MKGSLTPATHTISLNDQIYCFELSGYEWSQNLVCIAVDSKIILGIVKFPEESESEQFEWNLLKEIYHETRCHAIALAPDTSLAVLPKAVKFCAAGADFNLRIFRSDLQSHDTVQLLKGHSSYVNSVAWDPEGKYLASVSDDHSCIIWNSHDDYEEKSFFYLKSSGMTVKWHPDDSEKILVAEKRGLIHMYNVASQQAVLSIECPKAPLMSADWSLNNRLHITALVAGDIITWDLRHPCRPLDIKPIHEDGGLIVRFSPSSEFVVASVGRPDITLKIMHLKSQITQLEAPLKLYGGLCWHYRLPYVGTAFDRKLGFWKVHTK